MVGGGSDGDVGVRAEPVDRNGRVVDRGQTGGQAGAARVVTIFVPPAVLDEMKAVFHLPVATNVRLKLTRRDRIGIQTRHEVTAVAGKKRSVRATHFAIKTQRDSATGNV